MRELSPWARKSQGRDQHRARYATYITSAAWYRRRDEWARAEAARVAPAPIRCRGGCGSIWTPDRDDLHHCSYDRLGDEAHEDLWPMCRDCHSRLHDLLDSSRSWRRIEREQANRLALEILVARHQRRRVVASREPGLRGYL